MTVRPESEPLVRLKGVSKKFAEVAAVHPLDLSIHHGDFLAILGPSGCGKTTLLNMIAGFLYPEAGSIEIDGRDVTRVPPDRRPTNMVFQSYGLFPHMTVGQNIAYGLRAAKTAEAEIKERVRETVQLVHLDGFEQRKVTALSGGQQQRVALARALIMQPKVLLLDEPLAALDLQLRKAMQVELRRIHRLIGGTFVFVTHDQGEAMALANRIAVMQAGRVVQEGTPREIYDSPATLFVSTFIGDANVLKGEARQGVTSLEAGLRFPSDAPDGPVVAVIRPELAHVEAGSGTSRSSDEIITLPGVVQDIVYVGTYARVTVLAGGVELVIHETGRHMAPDIEIGSGVNVWWSLLDQLVLPNDKT